MYVKYFIPFPVLETPRLLLRRMENRDAKHLFACYHAPETARFSTWEAHPDLRFTKDYVQYVVRGYGRQESMVFCIVNKEENRVIGTCSFANMDSAYQIAEIGYTLSPAYWHCGYGTEAVSALLRFGFEKIGLRRISAQVMAGNSASVTLLQRLGFQQEGFLQDGVYCKGALHDLYLFGLLQTEYRRNKEINEKD